MKRLRVLNVEPRAFSAEARHELCAFCDLVEVEASRADIVAQCGAFDAMIVRLGHRIDGEVIDAGAFGRLRAISSATTGLDHIDLEHATKCGVTVLSLRGETAFLDQVTATAELTWALLLALIRHVPAAVADTRDGNWQRDLFRGIELSGRTLGVVGYGRLGRMVARYGVAFGMDVLVADPVAPPSLPEGVRRASLADLLAGSDVVTLHVPLCAETRHMIGQEEIGTMRRGALLLNTSRGEIVDSTAVHDALVTGQLAGVGLDVLDGEVAGLATMRRHPLIELANRGGKVLVTPHIGGATADSMRKTEVFMARKLKVWARASGFDVGEQAQKP